MPDVSFGGLVVVSAVALGAPLLVGFLPWLRVPSVVLEIVAGILLGPSVLGWVEVDLPINILAIVGLAFLLFLAGLEIDLMRLRGSTLRTALLGFVATIVLGVVLGVGFDAAGWVSDPLFLAVTLAATSLGLVIPVLKDAGQSESTVGQVTIAGATVADFAAVILLSLFFSTSGGSTGGTFVLLVAFAVLVAGIGVVVSRVGMSTRISDVLLKLQDTTAEIRVRAAVLLLIGFVALAERFGLESILGAFVAGAVVGLVDRDSSSHPRFRVKLDAIGFGFVVPVFFVTSGIRLDLRGLFEEPSALLRVPLFLAAMLVIRGLPALLYAGSIGRRPAVAAGLLQATSLPFIVTATQIGQSLDKVSSVTGAALVCAGLLSVVAFPSTALGLLQKEQPADQAPAEQPPEPTAGRALPSPRDTEGAPQPRP